MKSYISGHLQNLIDEFRRYFPDVVNEGTVFIRNPFRCEVKDVQLGMYRVYQKKERHFKYICKVANN